MNRIITLIFVSTLLIVSMGGLSFAFDNGDPQFFSITNAGMKLNDKWKAQVSEELYWGDNMRTFYYQHTDLGLAYSGLPGGLVLSMNYRRIYSLSNNSWLVENRPHLNATANWKIADYSLSNRLRLEYRSRESGGNSWRLRNRFNVAFPVKLTALGINPYLADDVFYDLSGGGFNQNEFWAGVNFKLPIDIKCGIAYVMPSTKIGEGNWKNYNALATSVAVDF